VIRLLTYSRLDLQWSFWLYRYLGKQITGFASNWITGLLSNWAEDHKRLRRRLTVKNKDGHPQHRKIDKYQTPAAPKPLGLYFPFVRGDSLTARTKIISPAQSGKFAVMLLK